MSVQSESGRLDYDKSDTSPKGTQMAGDVVVMPRTVDQAVRAIQGQGQNMRNMGRESTKPVGQSNIDTTNIKMLRGGR